MSGPFVNWQMKPTSAISSTPVLIFGNDVHTCLLDGIVLANLVNKVILVTLSIAREVESAGVETNFVFGSQIPIQPYDKVDALLNIHLTLEAGDLLYASSDSSDNIFNTFVSYRELTEL